MIGPATSSSDWPFTGVGGVEVHDATDALGGTVGDTGDHHPAVAVPDQDHVAEIFVVEHRDDVGDVQVEIDRGAQQVRSLPQPGERGGVHVVARGPQQTRDTLVAPPTVRAAVDENIGRHCCSRVRGTWARSPRRLGTLERLERRRRDGRFQESDDAVDQVTERDRERQHRLVRPPGPARGRPRRARSRPCRLRDAVGAQRLGDVPQQRRQTCAW